MMNGVYNNRLFNVPAPAGYGVTTPQNLGPYFAQGDRFYTTNFGMATQYNLFNPGYDQLTYHVAQNPQLATTNPMLFGYVDGMGSAPSSVIPSVTGAAAGSAGQGMPSMGGIAQQRLAQETPAVIAGLESNLQEVLKNDKLDDKQKARVQQKINELNNLKKELEQALKDPSISADKLYEIESKLAKFKVEVGKLGQDLANELQAREAAKAKSDAIDAEKDAKKGENADKKDAKTARETHEATLKSMDDICRRLDKAMYGCGTNYDDDADGMYTILQKEINEDNILELFEQWEATYAKTGDYKDDDDGFIESLMDECEGDQKEEVASLIVSYLSKRADKLGIDVSSEVAEARSEMKSDFWGARSDDDIQRTVNALYKKVKAANDKHIQETDKKAEADKAKADKETAAKEKEAKDLFLTDMREILKDPSATVSSNVTYDKENGFKVRVMGTNYYGSCYKELADALTNSGYDPKEYLAQQHLNTNA